MVAPSRSTGGQRVYSDRDVLRLSLLRRVVGEGRSIGQVALVPTEELQGLVREDEAQRHAVGMLEPLGASSGAIVLERARKAVGEMDSRGLERLFASGSVTLSVSTVIDDVVVPLLSDIGTAWKAGRNGTRWVPFLRLCQGRLWAGEASSWARTFPLRSSCLPPFR